MHYRKGIAAIVFRKTGEGPLFLIFHRVKNWEGWELLKGGLLDEEDDLTCLKRELEEETGIREYEIIPTDYKVMYKWPKHFVKDHHMFTGAINNFYLVEVQQENVRVDTREHDEYRWVSKEEALKLLTYDNTKRALERLTKKYGELFEK